MSIFRTTLLLLFLTSTLQAQETKTYATIDELLDQLYGVISGPKGERDWDTFRNLFHSTAMMGSTGVNADGETQFYAFSPEQYIERNGPMFLKYDFHEKEIKRKTQIYGRVAQVFTSYEFELTTPEQTRKQRGINCIQLAMEKERWWITNIIWHSESDSDPLPEDMSDMD